MTPTEEERHEPSNRQLAEGLALRTGIHHTVIIQIPKQNPIHTIPATVFAFASAFPGPGIALHLKALQEIVDAESSARLAVFGHTDPKGGDVSNKLLSDRRAQAVLALLVGDLDMFDGVAKEDGWNLHQYQAMLRALGCNPGAIDGKDGPMTREAAESFQEEYNQDVFHDGDVSRAHPDLVVDGVIGPKTKAALHDAYVAEFTVQIAESQFAGPKFCGCSEFNPVPGGDAMKRRVVVGLFGEPAPADDEFPCKEGDESACAIDDKGRFRCSFYRTYIEEKDDEEFEYSFYDFQWLREASGASHLSAVTTVPDGTDVTFRVYKCENEVPSPPPDSSSGDPPPDVGPELGSMRGEVVGGICFARWRPPKDYDPFDYDAWLDESEFEIDKFLGMKPIDAGEESTLEKLGESPNVHPPIFKIEAGETWGFSGPPGQRLNRVRFTKEEDETGVAIRSDGSMVKFEASEGTIEAEDDVEIISLIVTGKKAEPEEEA